jgi:hypothetical protein
VLFPATVTTTSLLFVLMLYYRKHKNNT